MSVPTDRKYTKTHEWHLADGNLVTIGITQFAADALTDITFVELPEVGTAVTAGQPFGEIESVKATSDMVTGVSGTVQEINSRLADEPELINDDPFGAGWVVKIAATDIGELDGLLDPASYEVEIAG